METSKKILAVLLIAVMSFGCGVAGGLMKDWVKDYILSKNDKIIDVSGDRPISEILDINNVTKPVKQDTNGNIIINVDYEYSLGEAIAEKVVPTVVSVTTVYEVEYSYGFFWGSNDKTYVQESSCVGTGFVVNSNGYILTNSHVVNDGDYKKIVISLYDGKEEEGEVLWNDSILDLAVIKIEGSGYIAAELGDSDTVKLGAYAAAIGNPLGLTFERSMSQGVISGLDRTITVSGGNNTVTMEGLLQTDAAINSGNSGGPLLNSKGQVIGVASAKASNGESLGFAIPINITKPIIEQIITNGSFERVYFGITAIGIEQQSSVSKDALIQYYGSDKGIYIASVTRGGGADEAGLKEGDVILKVNNVSVGTMNKMYSILVSFKSGEKVKVEYLRDGKTLETTVELKTSQELE